MADVAEGFHAAGVESGFEEVVLVVEVGSAGEGPSRFSWEMALARMVSQVAGSSQ